MSKAPISSAKNIYLNRNSGTLPDLNDALRDWFQAMTFGVITKAFSGFQVVETQVEVSFQGVIQPFTSRDLEQFEKGQRDWDWQWLHADPSLNLRVDDLVTYQATQYRVMGKKDYSKYGYVEYHIVNDYTVRIPQSQGVLLTEDGQAILTEAGDPLDPTPNRVPPSGFINTEEGFNIDDENGNPITT